MREKKGERKREREREREGQIEEKREKKRTRRRSARFKEPTVVKEPSSSLHLDTHKYKTQRFELTRREGTSVLAFFYCLSPLSLSFSFSFISSSLCPLPCRLPSYIGAANLFHVAAFSGPFTIFGHAAASSTVGHQSLEDTALSHP